MISLEKIKLETFLCDSIKTKAINTCKSNYDMYSKDKDVTVNVSGLDFKDSSEFIEHIEFVVTINIDYMIVGDKTSLLITKLQAIQPNGSEVMIDDSSLDDSDIYEEVLI